MSSRRRPLRHVVALAAALAVCAAPAARAEQAKEHVGGTLRMVARSAAGTIDPQINYTIQFWQVFQILYDGLLAFQKANGTAGFTVVPDLAEAVPAPQDGGKTYVFKLRKGVKFSNGNDVTVDDVVHSYNRIFRISGPTAGSFYNNIVGADVCLKTPANCTLSGVAGDAAAGTVTFHLVDSDSEFLYKIAVPHAAILPAETPDKDVGTVSIPTTGPYTIADFDPNKSMKLTRNPNFKQWSQAAQPAGYPDEIDYDFGLTDEAEVTAVENGQADWMFDQPPSDRLNELGTKYSELVHLNPLLAFWYMPMNTNAKPFNNLDARLAVSYAIDRTAALKLFGGVSLGAPSCQMLPPGMPGYAAYCPYTKNPGAKFSAPDMDKALEHMKKSGMAGEPVTIIHEDTTVSRAIATYTQSVLEKLGFKTSMKALSPDIEFTYIQNTKNNVQISVSQWYQDYPAVRLRFVPCGVRQLDQHRRLL
jgi:peptide/nickel transport system substrate-binding protein